jgi:hypothetical protein
MLAVTTGPDLLHWHGHLPNLPPDCGYYQA